MPRSTVDTPWRGRAAIGDGWAAFVGCAGDNAVHRHHALQIAVAFDRPFKLWTGSAGMRCIRCAAVLGDEPHRLLPSSSPLGLLYLDAESTAGRALSAGLRSGAIIDAALDSTTLRDHLTAASHGDRSACAAIVEQLLPMTVRPTADADLAALLDRLARVTDLDLGVADLARQVHLSPSRFAHRFRAHAGMPVRPYLRWLRLQRAAVAIAGGSGITTAAHEAGFADAAHLSRTFRRHFGVPPSVLVGLSPSSADGQQMI